MRMPQLVTIEPSKFTCTHRYFYPVFRNDRSGKKIIEAIPKRISDPEILKVLRCEDGCNPLSAAKSLTLQNDKTLAGGLGITTKTFGIKRRGKTGRKKALRERVIHIMALFQHEKEVFGSIEAFKQWLDTENFHLDGEKPDAYMGTISGIRF